MSNAKVDYSSVNQVNAKNLILMGALKKTSKMEIVKFVLHNLICFLEFVKEPLLIVFNIQTRKKLSAKHALLIIH